MALDLEDVKREVAAANRVLANLGLATGFTAALGHHMRVARGAETFSSKAASMNRRAVRAGARRYGDVRYRGFLIGGRAGLTQCSEVKIHACIYKTHPNMHAVVDVHPRYTILMSILTGR